MTPKPTSRNISKTRYRLASALGGLGFNLVLNSQFAEAQTRCEKAQRLANEIGDGVQRSDRDDLIPRPAFPGPLRRGARHLPPTLGQTAVWKTFGEVPLEDFAAFDKAGLTHPDLSRMK
jgi:hypothetical protein